MKRYSTVRVIALFTIASCVQSETDEEKGSHVDFSSKPKFTSLEAIIKPTKTDLEAPV